jgi:RNA polymerase sigma factor (TIGR02999 family)
MDPSRPPSPEPTPDANDPGRQRAFAALITAHYDSLRQVAERTLRAEHETVGLGAAALGPTSLVTEAVIRLMHQRELPRTKSHLRGLASVFMTRVIADRRRRRLAGKRDARITERLDTEAEGALVGGADRPGDRDELVRLEEAMIEIAARHPRQVEVVTLHSVAGIPLERVAEMLGVSPATAQRDFASGRARLARAVVGRTR